MKQFDRDRIVALVCNIDVVQPVHFVFSVFHFDLAALTLRR